MGLLDNLMSKIFSHASSTGPGNATSSVASAGTASSTPAPAPAQQSRPGGGAAAATQEMDVAAILDGLAAKNREKLNWRNSIVDLMKLVGMDSSLSARKQLANELGYSGNQSDTASMNVWLHKQVLRKLAENGGKVPQELLK
jgi:hypothetical protein